MVEVTKMEVRYYEGIAMELRATEKGKSIKEYVVELIEKDLQKKRTNTVTLASECVCSKGNKFTMNSISLLL